MKLIIDGFQKQEGSYNRLRTLIRMTYPQAIIKKTDTLIGEGLPVLIMYFEPNTQG